jgi:hypothetical protein
MRTVTTETGLRACGDCGAKPGQPHTDGCDVARCLQTGLQRLSCGEDHDCGHEVWTGRWPGEAECQEFGWWSVFDCARGWMRCDRDTPGAGPDLNRLIGSGEAVWDREQQRWVKRGNEDRGH